MAENNEPVEPIDSTFADRLRSATMGLTALAVGIGSSAVMFAGGKRKIRRNNKITNKTRRRNKKTQKTKKKSRNHTTRLYGGKILDAGGFGCVFKPALKCKGNNQINRQGKISKLMKTSDTDEEYYDIMRFLPIIKKIPHYNNYFVIDNIIKCEPDNLTKDDLDNFSKCTSFRNYNITDKNINSHLNQFSMLTEPDGGLKLDEYIKLNYTQTNKIILVNNSLIELLINGIIPMNKLKIYHFDIKGSNILIDDHSLDKIYARLIDWGLAHYLINNTEQTMEEISHRPYQFNLPYSVIIFNKKFNLEYYMFLSTTSAIYENIYKFMLNYITELEKTSKGAHIRGTIKDFKLIFNGKFTLSIIAKYITDILFKYTKNNKLHLSKYLPIFLHNVDIWGLSISYLSISEIISKKHTLNDYELQIIQHINKLFTLVIESNTIPINVSKLVTILKSMNTVFDKPLNSENNKQNLYMSSNQSVIKTSKLTDQLKKHSRHSKTNKIKIN